MFERFTEKARRVIFFARYEASQFGGLFIDTEHLLLGVTREDKGLLQRINLNAETLRKEVESRSTIGEKTSVSIDLPLSAASIRAMTHATEEADALGHDSIDAGHLLLGLLREDASMSAIILREQGASYDAVREIVRVSAEPTHRHPPVESPSVWEDPQPVEAAAPALMSAVLRLQELIGGASKHLDISDAYGEQRLKRRPWSRKEALGHLIDCATTHHQWLARALTQPRLAAFGYPMEEWVSAQHYQKLSWRALIYLWISMNNLLLHVIAVTPEEKVNMACRIGIADPIPLAKLIDQYLTYVEDLVGQMLARLESTQS
jgi:hypothetical protein